MTQARGARVFGRARHVGRGAVDARGMGCRGDRVRGRRRPAEAGERRDRSASGRVAAGAVEVEVIDARAAVRRRRSSCRRCRPTRSYEGKYPLVSALVAPGHRRASRRVRAPARRRRGRSRLHRQGQRPGAVRGVVAHPGARPRGARAGPRVGSHPRRLHRARRQVGHPDRGDEGEAVLDRREHVGPRDRVRRAREPVGVGARRAVHAHARTRRTRPRAARHRRRRSSRACPVALDGERDGSRRR